MKHFLTLMDRTPNELKQLVQNAIRLKKERNEGKTHHLLAGKKLGLIFEKSSTRTRVSFEVGMYELGGYPLFLSSHDIQIGRGESIADTARVLSRYLDGVMIRTFAHAKLEEFARYASIPVVNGLSDDYHPCQVMADLMTVYERFGRYEGLKMAYVGDGNNMAHSLMLGAARFGMHIAVASPAGYEPQQKVVDIARNEAQKSGSSVLVTHDPAEAVQGADIIYTDVWASMGQEDQAEGRKAIFAPFQVNRALMDKTGKDTTIFMHCLPAHRGEEVTEEVLESPASVIFDEAENRLHAQKAILVDMMQ